MKPEPLVHNSHYAWCPTSLITGPEEIRKILDEIAGAVKECAELHS
jgi:hypothetical protein